MKPCGYWSNKKNQIFLIANEVDKHGDTEAYILDAKYRAVRVTEVAEKQQHLNQE